MSELEPMLRALGREIEYPPTPAFEVRAAGSPQRARPPRRVLAFATLALVLAAGAGAAAVIELRGVTIHRVERLPSGLPGPGDPRPLGREVTLADARALAGFDVLVPTQPPASVHYSAYIRGGAVTLVYPEAQITEFLGDTDRDFVTKLATAETRVEEFRIDGRRAIWLEGAPHAVYVRDSRGMPREETLRLAGNVLLLERKELLVRIEGALNKREAVALARSLG